MTAGLVRDTWRAVLVVVVTIVLREVLADKPVPPQPVAATMPPAPYMAMPAPAWQPVPVPPPVPEHPKPLRRIGSAVVELGDSLIGAIRR